MAKSSLVNRTLQSFEKSALDFVGVVVIGRNEGQRLVACLKSLKNEIARTVYVDSDSDDGSMGKAEQFGAETIQLGSRVHFTAARARNAGLEKLLSVHPDTRYVQFVDGDCEIDSAWVGVAVKFLETQDKVGIVAGRRREKFPEKSVFNRLCDMEWDTAVGPADYCGGDFMARVEAMNSVGGFNAQLIAGEEPELCYRLRKQGWLVHRLDAEMTRHDASIYRIRQWIRRSIRAGYAYASGAALHFRDGRGYLLRENLNIVAWAAMTPFLCALLAVLVWPWGLISVAIFPVQLVRMAVRGLKKYDFSMAIPFAVFNMLGKWPELLGQLRFAFDAMGGFQRKIIEYK